MTAPKILFIHENYPAQFGPIGGYLAGLGWDVVFATASNKFTKGQVFQMAPSGMRVVRYSRKRNASPDIHPYLKSTELAVLNGQGFARCAIDLRDGGFNPDIIVAHSGWGSGSLAKVVWPKAKFVQYLEWWYNYPPVDVAKGAEAEFSEDGFASVLCRNLPFLLDAQTADAILLPTKFQRDQMPDWLQARATVIHDGVDTESFRPEKTGDKRFTVEGLPDDAKIVTYATRGMEPMRGFPEFMRDLEQIQKEHPSVHAVIAGTDSIHYSGNLPEGDTWKNRALREGKFDLSRVHFVGKLPMSRYRQLLRRSNAHVYLTRPFVLSWSLLEAMSTACPLIVSNTAPVREIIDNRKVAISVDFEVRGEIANAVGRFLSDPTEANKIGRNARVHVSKHLAQQMIFPAKLKFFKSILEIHQGNQKPA